MFKFAAFSIAALAASTAVAQTPNTDTAASPATTTTQPVAPAGAAQTTSETPATTASTATNSNSQVAAVIEAGFPRYDVDKSGSLSATEFKQWISDLKTAELTAQGKPADAATVSQYASAALASADKDKDGSVSKQDLTTFLGG